MHCNQLCSHVRSHVHRGQSLPRDHDDDDGHDDDEQEREAERESERERHKRRAQHSKTLPTTVKQQSFACTTKR